jgi:hypothetical protein
MESAVLGFIDVAVVAGLEPAAELRAQSVEALQPHAFACGDVLEDGDVL